MASGAAPGQPGDRLGGVVRPGPCPAVGAPPGRPAPPAGRRHPGPPPLRRVSAVVDRAAWLRRLRRENAEQEDALSAVYDERWGEIEDTHRALIERFLSSLPAAGPGARRGV